MRFAVARRPSERAVRAGLTLVAVGCIVTGLQSVASATAASIGYRADNSLLPLKQSPLATGSGAASEGPDFVRRPYLGIGAGFSRLEPRSRSDALTIGDENDAGFHVFAGYDLLRWLSAEVYFADLGAADIDFLGAGVGDIEYQVYGLNAIGYLYNSRSGFGLNGASGSGLSDRTGLSLYLGLGLGGMNNDSQLDYRKDYDTHASFSAGLEYGFDNGVALRAELASFDTDAQYASLSVLKRFGSTRRAAPVSSAPPAAKVAQDDAPIVRTVAPALPDGPTFFRPIVPPYIYFPFDSATLEASQIAKLDIFVQEVGETGFGIAVDGHSDWLGPETYNQTLSSRRSRVVFDYLVAAGIDPGRLEARAFGEARPVSTNLSVEGRSQNRRTEFALR